MNLMFKNKNCLVFQNNVQLDLNKHHYHLNMSTIYDRYKKDAARIVSEVPTKLPNCRWLPADFSTKSTFLLGINTTKNDKAAT